MAVTRNDPRRVLAESLAQLARLENELESETVKRAEQVQAIDDDYRRRTEPLRLRRERLLAETLSFAEAHKDALITRECRSVDLPHGRVGWRRQPAHLEVTDGARLCAFAARKALVRTVVRPDMYLVKKYAEEHEIIPDGMTLEPASDNPYVKLF